MITPVWYSASTKQIAEKALERGILKYPGLCYIRDMNGIAWVSSGNKMEYIRGDNQITDVKYENSFLKFFNGNELLFSYDISMTNEDKNNIVSEIKRTMGLEDYIKSADLSKVLDDIIGDLPDRTTVIDYINSLSYDKLSMTPVMNLSGSLTDPIIVSTLDDGIYKIKGKCIIGGNNTTVQSCADNVLYFVSHNLDDSSVSITKIYGRSITLYFIKADGTYTTDRYVTESWIDEQNYATADSMKEYVKSIIEKTMIETIDERIDSIIDRKFSGIDSTDIANIFKTV